MLNPRQMVSMPGPVTWTTKAAGSRLVFLLPPRSCCSQRMPELTTPQIWNPRSGWGSMAMSERSKSTAGDRRRSSYSLKGRGVSNSRRRKPLGGPWSGGKTEGGARMMRRVTERSSSRIMLTW